jgi:hypothetical protein
MKPETRAYKMGCRAAFKNRERKLTPYFKRVFPHNDYLAAFFLAGFDSEWNFIDAQLSLFGDDQPNKNNSASS